MIQPTWKWSEDGSVEVGGVAYKSADGLTKESILAYSRNYAEKTMVFTVLFRAKRAFETGATDYQGARERLPGLLREYGLAEMDLEAAAGGIDAFFTPAGISASFSSDSVAFSKFLEALSSRLEGKG